MDEIYAYARSRYQVEESKSTRPHRFRLMLGEDARSFRSKPKMECSTRRLSFLQRIFLESMENRLVRKILRRLTSLEIFKKILKTRLWNLQDQHIEPEYFEGRIIILSMSSTGQRKEIQKSVFRIPNKSRITRRDSREDTGHFYAQVMKKNGTERTPTHLEENRCIATEWWDISKNWTPSFKGISALNRGILTRRGGRCTIHFSADSLNTELLFRTIHSANQLSIHGAESSWCEELAQWILGQNESTGEKSAAKENEQPLKNVKPQEGILWCKLQRATMVHLETDCENNFRDSEHWRKTSNLR